MNTDTSSNTVSRRAGWSIFMGLLTVAVGVVMLIYSTTTAILSSVFLGSMLLVAALAQFAFAFSSETAGNFFLKLLLGILYGIAGIALAAFPLAGAITLTGVIGMMLITESVIEIVLAVGLRGFPNRGWLVFNAIASGVLGALILSEWPASSTWAIGTMIGVSLVINGITRMVISGTVLQDARAAERMTPKHA